MSDWLLAMGLAGLGTVVAAVAVLLKYFDVFVPNLSSRDCSHENLMTNETRCISFVLRPIVESKDVGADLPEFIEEVRAKYNLCLYGIHKSLNAMDTFDTLRNSLKKSIILCDVSLGISVAILVGNLLYSEVPYHAAIIPGIVAITYGHVGITTCRWMQRSKVEYETYSRNVPYHSAFGPNPPMADEAIKR